jgi:hypothetical protein
MDNMINTASGWSATFDLAKNFANIDRHTGTVCGCVKRCVYDGGTGYGHREAVFAGEAPKYPALKW